MDIPVWPGSSSFTTGSTPFGFYDTDANYQADADKVATWCAYKLGYPILSVEMQDVNFYACFEEAVTEFSNQVNMYNAKDYMMSLQGASTSSNLTGRLVSPSLGRTIQLAKNYGTEAGSGGNIDWRSGSILLEPNVQDYDLDVLFTSLHNSGGAIEIKRVFHQATPAIARYFDPFTGTGQGSQQMMDTFGWGGMSPSVSFLVMPLYADILRMQAIEVNDEIRKSGFSFELRNNKLKIFPIPIRALNLHFEYILLSDRSDPLKTPAGVISDISNAPYNRMEYTNISQLGKGWINRFTLALAKELLGLIRGKYATIPVPGAETTLNGSDLATQGREDKVILLTELTGMLDAMTRKGQMEQEKAISEAMNYQLARIPMPIYIL